MDLLPTSEQQALIDATIDFLSHELPCERLRKPDCRERELSLWPRMAEMGWFGLLLTEDEGGLGTGLAEAAMLFREFGRYLLSPAVLATALAARVAVDGEAKELSCQLTEGKIRAAFAVCPPHVPISNPMTGVCTLIDAVGADVVLIWNGTAAALFPADAFERSPSPPVDPHISIENARLLGAHTKVHVRMSPLRDHASVLLAAMLSGIAIQERDMAVEHAKTRQQFGRFIGSFQAIKHACAEMALKCEAADSLTKLAALTVQDQLPDADRLAASAKVIALDAAYGNGASNIQIHGGMGFTAECLAHFYVKRTHVLEQVGGEKRQQLAQALGPHLDRMSA